MIKATALALALATATAGHALTYTVAPGAPDPGPAAGQSILVDFNSATLPAGYTLTGAYTYATGTTNAGAAPAGDKTQYLYVSSALSPNNATLTTAFDLSKISFYWGSIDKYNSVDVLGAGGVTLGSFGGSLFPPSDGDQHMATSNERVSFTASTGEVITGLRFTSTGVAFEVDDIAGTPAGDGNANGVVPEPAAWALMIGGFGMVGVASRRRRSAISTVAA
nr:PEPxxWA-CTERM sorting domain-containing protein [Polymorphobacter sp.]